ncbi:hypothetical protein EDC04DRAFT_2666787 [Pisolithus marmoratus]|nr:hypothetical protein EDC04DRAFT_2666787 [Pisolithus marmoratus]
MFDSSRDTTSLSQETNVWSQHIYAASDYCTVVQGRTQVNVGEYFRPVNWILPSQPNRNLTFVILSPFEVNELLPEIRNRRPVYRHIYTTNPARNASL